MTNSQNRKGWVKVTLADKKLLRDTKISALQNLGLSSCKLPFQTWTKPQLSSSKIFTCSSY